MSGYILTNTYYNLCRENIRFRNGESMKNKLNDLKEKGSKNFLKKLIDRTSKICNTLKINREDNVNMIISKLRKAYFIKYKLFQELLRRTDKSILLYGDIQYIIRGSSNAIEFINSDYCLISPRIVKRLLFCIIEKSNILRNVNHNRPLNDVLLSKKLIYKFTKFIEYKLIELLSNAQVIQGSNGKLQAVDFIINNLDDKSFLNINEDPSSSNYKSDFDNCISIHLHDNNDKLLKTPIDLKLLKKFVSLCNVFSLKYNQNNRIVDTLNRIISEMIIRILVVMIDMRINKNNNDRRIKLNENLFNTSVKFIFGEQSYDFSDTNFENNLKILKNDRLTATVLENLVVIHGYLNIILEDKILLSDRNLEREKRLKRSSRRTINSRRE